LCLDEITEIVPSREEESFDLQVIKNNNFILNNGIVTHNSGKTTLQITLLKKFLERNRVVLFRDDGGLEFPYLSAYYDTRIFIPNEKSIELDLIGFKADIVRFNDPREIISQVYDYSYPLNVIVYDVFCDTARQRAIFYSKLFMGLIGSLQRKRKSQKRKMVFGIDELNDLIPPRGKGSVEASITRADIEMNIRKIRKHKVQIIASSHRFNQIGVDTRSQMEQIYFKKSYGYDVWDFLSKNLITSNSKTFWGMVKRMLTLPRNQFVLFDENRHFDLYTFPDIPRDPNIDIEAIGSIPIESKDKNAIYRQRYLAWMELVQSSKMFLKEKEEMIPITIKWAAEHDKVTASNIYSLKQKHLKEPEKYQHQIEKLANS